MSRLPGGLFIILKTCGSLCKVLTAVFDRGISPYFNTLIKIFCGCSYVLQHVLPDVKLRGNQNPVILDLPFPSPL